jgi:hypothetical protein
MTKKKKGRRDPMTDPCTWKRIVKTCEYLIALNACEECKQEAGAKLKPGGRLYGLCTILDGNELTQTHVIAVRTALSGVDRPQVALGDNSTGTVSFCKRMSLLLYITVRIPLYDSRYP